MAPFGVWVDLGSGLLIAALGLTVALVRPRRSANAAFATFAMLLGLTFVVNNLELAFAAGGGLPLVSLGGTFVGFVLSSLALIWVALRFPRPLPSAQRRLLWPPLGVAVPVITVAVVEVGAMQLELARINGASGSIVVWNTLNVSGFILFHVVLWAFLALLAARFWCARSDPERLELALAAGALGIYPAYFAGTWINGPLGTSILPLTAALTLVQIAMAVVYWLYASARAAGGVASARNLALLLPGVMLLGMLTASIAGGLQVVNEAGVMGASRLLGVAVFSYAVLKHQLMGIELKLRWTVHRGTVATVFAAAFFVASELVEALLDIDGTWVGLVAAAGVALALRPVRALAERVAESVLPGVTDTTGYRDARREELYRTALQFTLADREVTEREERHLVQLAESLRIGAEDASRMRGEVQRQFAAPMLTRGSA